MLLSGCGDLIEAEQFVMLPVGTVRGAAAFVDAVVRVMQPFDRSAHLLDHTKDDGRPGSTVRGQHHRLDEGIDQPAVDLHGGRA